MKVKDYTTIIAERHSELELEVWKKIDKGWQPFAGPYEFQGKLCQAMVTYYGEVQ